MLTESQQADLILATNNFRLKAMEIYNKEFDLINITWDLKGSCGGKAYYYKWLIRFNPVLAAQNWDYFIVQTVGHEVAHLISYKLHGRAGKGHGEKWKQVMEDLGLEVKRCHSYDTTDVQLNTKRFVYFCPDCDKEFKVGKRRHTNHQNGLKYRCNSCNTNIQFDYEIPLKNKSVGMDKTLELQELLKQL